MERKGKDRALQWRKVIGPLGKIMKGKNMTLKVEKKSIILPPLTYSYETWTLDGTDASGG